jgi:Ribbon-helix-helix protein, copG family
MQAPKVLVRGNLNPETYDRLGHLAVDRRVSRSSLVEEAVEAYLAGGILALDEAIPAPLRTVNGGPGLSVAGGIDGGKVHLALVDTHADGSKTAKAIDLGNQIAVAIQELVARRTKGGA